MAVFRVEKNANYTTMSNYHLRDKGLSLKAKGLLSFCLSLPDSWDYSVMGLVAVCKEGRDCIMSTLSELEETGYLRRSRARKADGTLGAAEYVIYEYPQPVTESTAAKTAAAKASDSAPSKSPGLEPPMSGLPVSASPMLEKPTQVIPTLEESALENPPQISTNLINTKLNNNEENKGTRHKYGAYRNVLLTEEELSRLKAEFPEDWQQRMERLSEYMASTGKHYRNHLATIRSWSRRDTLPKDKPREHYSPQQYVYAGDDSL